MGYQPDVDYASLGKKLRELRESAGLKQDEAAEIVGRTGSWLSLVESGQVQAPITKLMPLVERYGGTMSVAVYGPDDPDAELLSLLSEGLPRLSQAERAKVRESLLGAARVWLLK